MDPLDKLEIILESLIKDKKRELKQETDKGIQLSSVYLYGIENQVDAFEKSLEFVRAIKRNSPSMSDEVVIKMYGGETEKNRGKEGRDAATTHSISLLMLLLVRFLLWTVSKAQLSLPAPCILDGYRVCWCMARYLRALGLRRSCSR